jgi:hypothetical protein
VRWRSRPAPDAEPDAAEQLRRLAEAGSVAFGGVGIAATILPETAAYHALAALADRRGAELRPGLERLVATATPAGKVFAATLLARVDPVAGRGAWRRLAGDRSPVQTFSGCIMGQTTLAEYAANQTGNG